MLWLKQSTAVTIKLGPFLDETDGKTAETALTISQADIRLSKNGGAFAQTNNAAGATHDEGGEYGIPLDTTDTNTLGTLKLRVHESGALPCWMEFMVVPAGIYNGLVLGTNLALTAGLTITQSTADTPAVSLTGNGTGAGLLSTSGSGATGDGIKAVAASTNGNGISGAGVGTGDGLRVTGGATGHGLDAIGGATSGNGANITATTSGHGAQFTSVGSSKNGVHANVGSGSGQGILAQGGGSGAGLRLAGGSTGNAANLVGGATSGTGMTVTTTSGDGIVITPTAGNALNLAANGTSKHGILSTGGTAGTSHGVSIVAGSGGLGVSLDTLTASGAVTVTGALTASNASNNVVGIDVAKFAGSAAAATNLSATYASFETGTAQAGGASTITLRAGASATNDLFKDQVVFILSGTGAGQTNRIASYVGATKVATVTTAWVTQPDATSAYLVLGRVG